METVDAATPSESLDGFLVIGGYILVMFLLAVTAYNLQGTFMRPGSLAKRAGRLLIAIGAIVAIVFTVTHTVKKGE